MSTFKKVLKSATYIYEMHTIK